ncbi:exosortase A [Elioraea thermophila]|uniref:exosortase A n=1 Tax=Elioraea thermophila TaxID=2185104 RepID=UPI000DF41911|nr:exosortase A [Elioraea thermophila]
MNVISSPSASRPAPAPEPERTPSPWRGPLIALSLGLAFLLGVVFAEEGAAAVRVWNNSTAYNHCWLIGPIAAWLAWQRRERAAHLAPAPDPRLALLAVPPALAWLAAERLGIMEGRQLTAWAIVQVFVLAVLGWRVAAAFAGPLAYTIFLIPFGGFTVPLLQHITARFIDIGLDVWGITHYTDGLLIETTAGVFHVAEACAGLRFTIAALAFGALYALTMFRSPGRRLIVMALAIIVPIIANGVRALGIVVAAEYIGSAEAAAADHVLYGWGFFSAIILLLVLAGLPFREDRADHPRAFWWRRLIRPVGPARGRAVALATAAGLAVAAAGPAAAALLSADPEPQPQPPRLAAGPCAAEGDALVCAGLRAEAQVLVFPTAATWNEVAAARRRFARETDTDLTFAVPTGAGGVWRVRVQGAEGRVVATASFLDGRGVGDGIATRLAQAKNSLGLGAGRPVVAAVELRAPEGAPEAVSGPRARAVAEALLAAQTEGLAAQAAALSRGQ